MRQAGLILKNLKSNKMHARNLLTLFFLSLGFVMSAQNHPTCDGSRYKDNVFSNVVVTTGINFGAATTISGNPKQLDMDIYEPSGDIAPNRPVIILGFGGSFIAGNREDLDFLCRAYAKKGFVAATIDYRLYDGWLLPLPSAETMQDVVTKAVADFKAAVRFFREDAEGANTYKVDPDLVFLGGISAGSIAAAHAAVMDSTDVYSVELQAIIDANGGLEGNSSNNLQYSSEVQGLINFSGGLGDADWLDENDPPLFSIHDEFDGVVPYGEGYGSILGFDIIYMEGSQIMHEVADDVGVQNHLITIEGSTGHVSFMSGQQNQKEAIDSSAVFLEELICGFVSSVTPETALAMQQVTVFPNPTNGILFLNNQEALSLRLNLVDVLGRSILQADGVDALDLSGFSKGIYLLEIEDLDTSSKTMRRVVVE
jgi:para-nitrobenzyl esterase